VLGYINTQTQAVKKLLETRKIGEAKSELDAMGAVSRDVYADVREAIVGLRARTAGDSFRASRLPESPAPHARLRDRASRRGRQGGRCLPPATEIQLVRIVQEALTNVRKHAGASHVDVIVGANGNEVGVEIVDDGQGFDPLLLDRTGWPRLGLQTMRERAQAVGGVFDVISAPGEGTRIAVHVPASIRREAVRAGDPR
jgi:signal transduction histidine kinase